MFLGLLAFAWWMTIIAELAVEVHSAKVECMAKYYTTLALENSLVLAPMFHLDDHTDEGLEIESIP